MTRRRGRRTHLAPIAALVLVIGVTCAGCGIAESLISPQVDDAVPIDAVPPVVQVLDGMGPTGAYRVAVYRDTVGNYCVELRTPPSTGAGCSPAASDLAAPSVSFEDRVTWITAGTASPDAAEARVVLADGTVVSTRNLSAPNPVTREMRFFVFALPPVPRPVTLAVVNAGGGVLEEWPLD